MVELIVLVGLLVAAIAAIFSYEKKQINGLFAWLIIIPSILTVIVFSGIVDFGSTKSFQYKLAPMAVLPEKVALLTPNDIEFKSILFKGKSCYVAGLVANSDLYPGQWPVTLWCDETLASKHVLVQDLYENNWSGEVLVSAPTATPTPVTRRIEQGARAIVPTPNMLVEFSMAMVTIEDEVRLRAEPGTKTKVIKKLGIGTQVITKESTIFVDGKEWRKIFLVSEEYVEQGWISEEFLKPAN